MIIKIIGACLIVFASFSAGCILSEKLYKRRDFLKSFLVMLSSLSTRIRYESADIFTLVSSSASEAELNCLIISSPPRSRSFEALWREKIRDIPKSYGIGKIDKKLLSDFGKELGKTDVRGQEKHIELYKNTFTNRLSQAEEAINQKSKLYKTMGFFVGTTLALMIV